MNPIDEISQPKPSNAWYAFDIKTIPALAARVAVYELTGKTGNSGEEPAKKTVWVK